MRPDLRLEIVEEHLDEAAFLYRQWESALRSPTESLEGVARGPEEVLLAHLDARAAAGGVGAGARGARGGGPPRARGDGARASGPPRARSGSAAQGAAGEGGSRGPP